MMEAVRTFETVVNLHQFTRRYNPEDNHLRDLFKLGLSDEWENSSVA
jgi:hypothetical protein